MSALWPLFDLRIETPRVTLRYPTDEDLAQVAETAATGIHDANEMPFSTPWSRAEPPALQRGVLQYVWSERGSLAPAKWSLPLVVFAEGEAVGMQDVFALEFATSRTVETGSWLARSAQGHGLGTEMRAAVLHLAFEHLGAVEAYSASFEDNPASAAVSLANGYEPNGSLVLDREGRPARNLKWRLTRERWLARRRDDITVQGVEPCLALLGAERQ